MIKYFTTLFLLCPLVICAQQRDNRAHSNFSKLSIAIPADVTITKGNTFSVVLIGDEDDLKKIESAVDGNTLELSREDDFSFWGDIFDDDVKVEITMPSLSEVSLAGSGNVRSKDLFTSNEFNLNVAGSGNIDLKIKTKQADINISGSGDIELSGSSKSADVNISGSGDLNAEDFKVASYDIKIVGSGDCDIHVTKQLDTRVMGSGDVTYTGDPSKINTSTMGSGNVRKR